MLSAFAPGKPPLSDRSAAWFRERSDVLFLSAITAAEVEAGIAKLRRRGVTSKAEALRGRFDGVLSVYADRVLPFDLAVARVAGELLDFAQHKGHCPGFADIAIAAIARSADLVLLTLNDRDFKPLGIETADPLAMT
jgi:predicted nucleic acid-binding protein